MCFKAENFKANSGLDLVRIGTKKWSVFGPILINLGPIWQVVALLMANTQTSLEAELFF